MPGRMPSPGTVSKAFATCSGMIPLSIWPEWSLFGPAGSPVDLPDVSGEPIDEKVLDEIQRRFGIQSR